MNLMSYPLHLVFLGTAVIVAGIIGYALLSWKYGGTTWVSHGIRWTPGRFAAAFAVILIVTLAIGAVVYLPHQ